MGNNKPTAPLSFPPELGKKIILYSIAFGVSGNRLQLFADHPNSDIALGYDAADISHESLAFKLNSALTVHLGLV